MTFDKDRALTADVLKVFRACPGPEMMLNDFKKQKGKAFFTFFLMLKWHLEVSSFKTLKTFLKRDFL